MYITQAYVYTRTHTHTVKQVSQPVSGLFAKCFQRPLPLSLSYLTATPKQLLRLLVPSRTWSTQSLMTSLSRTEGEKIQEWALPHGAFHAVQ